MMVLAEVAAIHTVAKIVISPGNARVSLKIFKNTALADGAVEGLKSGSDISNYDINTFVSDVNYYVISIKNQCVKYKLTRKAG